MKDVFKKIGVGAGKVAAVPLVIAGAAISAVFETTGGRGIMRDALKDSSDQKLMEIYNIHDTADGDHDTCIACKSLLQERGYEYNYKTKKWEK